MALTLVLTQVDAAVAGRSVTFTVAVTNTSTSSVTLNSLVVGLTADASARISQPNFLTPNVALGVGNPTLTASGSATYPFEVVFQQPNGPGVSPSSAANAGGTFAGASGAYLGQPPEPNVGLSVVATASDGSVGSAQIQVSALSQVAPFPPVTTGTLQLQFEPGFNLIGLAVGL